MPGNQINVEYFFRLLYNLLFGESSLTDVAQFKALMAYIWSQIIVIGYALSVIAMVCIVYFLMRIFELREHEEEHYGRVLLAPDQTGENNPRWRQIEQLMEGVSGNDWRQAIVEADIMLEECLAKQGYVGEGVGEKLKQAGPTGFDTIQDAWEAHKVRNQIAHEGSAFDLSESLARRTIARYKNVFHEFKLV